jgi:hypothetical protein
MLARCRDRQGLTLKRHKDDHRCKRVAEQTGNRTKEPDRLAQEC